MQKKFEPPRRCTIKRYIETPEMVVALEVSVIYAPEDPDEPLLEMDTLRLLGEVTRRAKTGDRQWLAKVGRIYEQVAV